MAYFYFKLDRVQTNKYFTKYQQTVLPLRNSILRALLKNTGAAGLRLKPFAMDVISEFYFLVLCLRAGVSAMMWLLSGTDRALLPDLMSHALKVRRLPQ